ncbi:MAG: YigZ family protein [Bacteroidota bacterium]
MEFLFKTLAEESEHLIKEKGSKFIGLAIACYSENEVNEQLKKWKQTHAQASHLCYAYRLGVSNQRYRANDDGEPSNTAGTPILGQIQSFELTNVLIGVIRYYGGTKLGVGGLIQAYRNAAKGAIEEGNIIEKELMSELTITFTYAQISTIMTLLKQQKTVIKSQDLNENCEICFQIENSKLEFIKNSLENIEHTKITNELIGK